VTSPFYFLDLRWRSPESGGGRRVVQIKAIEKAIWLP